MTGEKMRQTKKQTIIEATSTKQGLNRFEAIPLGDSCLNTTVSDLKRQGYKFHSVMERVPNRFGTSTNCKRYWLIGKPQPKQKA